jgi:hypothetical protein
MIEKKYVVVFLILSEEERLKKNENSEYVFENEKEIASLWLTDIMMNEVRQDIFIVLKLVKEIEMSD